MLAKTKASRLLNLVAIVLQLNQSKKDVNPLMFVSSKPAEQSLGLVESIIQRRIR
jgi:hypothetical protein